MAMCCPVACIGDVETPLPAELQAAQDALSQNLALGESLAGGPATAEQAAEAEKLIQDGLAAARSYASEQPEVAEAHHLIGMLLLFAYRPVVSTVTTTDDDGSTSEVTITSLRRGGEMYCEEGLTELRAAKTLVPKDIQYQLDYAEGLQACGQAQRSGNLLTALWLRAAEMTATEKTRAARLLALAARQQGQPHEEARWLREVVSNDPQDEEANRRLAELRASTRGTIAWLDYEAGMRSAQQQRRPVMIDFMASWCHWCKKLDREVYTSPEVIALSQEFVCVKVDGDRRPGLARKHRVSGYPTILFLGPKGQELSRVRGYEPTQAFLSDMRKALRPRGGIRQR
jgi:thiol-disulfide isomerase/thioredoxin